MSLASTKSQALSSQIELADALSARDRQQMLVLMQTYYDGVQPLDFHCDLSEKHWVITLRTPSGEVCGFSTQVLLQVPGQLDSLALFSGDTIIASAYRGRNDLAGLWGRLALEQIDLFPDKKLYWFLISKGYKTYRYLSLFFREYYPRHGFVTPPKFSNLIHALAERKFGDRFDATQGIVRAAEHGCHLRAEVAPILSHRLRDPNVSFFVESNPGHVLGDELCCLAPLHRQNFTSVAYRVIAAASTTEAR
jgi:hypothetical protein